MNKIGRSVDLLGKELQFLYNGINLDPFSNELVSSKIKNNAIILVIEMPKISSSYSSNSFNSYNFYNPQNSSYFIGSTNNSFNNNNNAYIIGPFQKELIPREERTLVLNFNKKIENNNINIEFVNKEGLRTNLSVPGNITISEMLQRYKNQIGYYANNIERNLVFLYNGFKLNQSSNDIVSSKFKNNDIINVSDISSYYSLYLQFCQIKGLNPSLETSYILFKQQNIGNLVNLYNNPYFINPPNIKNEYI